MTFLSETPVIATVSATVATHSSTHSPVSPSSARTPCSSALPTRPPARPAAAIATSAMRKYAHAAPPSVAIVRGTLISRNTIVASSAISTGNQPAA